MVLFSDKRICRITVQEKGLFPIAIFYFYLYFVCCIFISIYSLIYLFGFSEVRDNRYNAYTIPIPRSPHNLSIFKILFSWHNWYEIDGFMSVGQTHFSCDKPFSILRES